MKTFLIVLIALFIMALPSNVHARYLGAAPFYISKYAQDVKAIKDIYVVNGNIELWGTPINNYNDFHVDIVKYYPLEDHEKFSRITNLTNDIAEGIEYLQGLVVKHGYYNIHVISARDIGKVPPNSFIVNLKTDFSFINLRTSQIIVGIIQPNLFYIPESCTDGYLICLTSIVEINPSAITLGETQNYRQANQNIEVFDDEKTKEKLQLIIKTGFASTFSVLKDFHWANHLRKK